ncbi:Phenylacetate-CoA oxygenase, PaaJ subunit [Caenispirillum salinarum AK4]|uniref:Phenylacetate-CoA oxygenase, PaaJ subunit n=2 Tax=Caenispirillum TaxID=414051 RepID=K9HK46_9PROT|nr:Phenylacetate-CoA oxygenase, PaaJ subunit [Caenispirillum salinarum AK4]
MVTAMRDATAEQRAWEALETVFDPEIPQLSIVDLGIVRAVEAGGDGTVRADLSPTYSGCPAVSVIELDAEVALRAAGFASVTIKRALSPAWTTDWITDRGRQKLLEAGIAPPAGEASKMALLDPEVSSVTCPHCGSENTEQVSEFGSTACKALHRCRDCLEPFDYFKCI